MAKRDPNKFEVKGNPSIWVTIFRHGEDGDHSKDSRWHYVFYHNAKRHRGSTGKLEHADAAQVAIEEAEKSATSSHMRQVPLRCNRQSMNASILVSLIHKPKTEAIAMHATAWTRSPCPKGLTLLLDV